VFIYGPTLAVALAGLLAKVGNPAPQIELEYDKKGRKIVQESKFLLRPIGDSAALLVEKVAAYPGLTLEGLSEKLDRPPSKVARLLAPVVEGEVVFEDSGGYYAPGNLLELLEEHLEHAGCNYRERNRIRRYAEERGDYADGLKDQESERQERLAETARACGVEDPEAGEVPKAEAEDVSRSHEEVPEDPEEVPVEVVKPGTEDTIRSLDEVLELALEFFGSQRSQRRDPLVHTGTAKGTFYSGESKVKPETSPNLADVVRAYLKRNPKDAEETPSWLASTIWCLDLYPTKPTPQEVAKIREALREEGRAA
jgi:hypothetical protein